MTTTGNSLETIIAQQLSQGQEDHEAIIEHVLGLADVLDLLYPVLDSVIVRVERGRARTKETALLPVAGPYTITTMTPTERNGAYKGLAGARFMCPDGNGGRKQILWNEATAQDHDRYAGYCRALAEGNLGTAQRHEQAARDIRAVPGATCLQDVINAQKASV